MDRMLLREAQLHGLKRLADKSYRWYWAVALLLLKWAAISVLLEVLWRFQDNPTRFMRLERFNTFMRFPTVVLAPELDFPEHRIDAFLDDVLYPDGMNRTYMKRVLRQLAAFYSSDIVYHQTDLENIEGLIQYNNLDLEYVTRNLTTSCDEALIKCQYRGVIMDCGSLFKTELHQFGYACIFNGRSLRRNFPKDINFLNYSSEMENRNNNSKKRQELRTTQIGYSSALTFAVNQSRNHDDIDLTYKWLTILSPRHFIEASVNGTPISPGKEVWVGSVVEGSYIDQATRYLSPTLRRCRLSHDSLKYFPTYHKYSPTVNPENCNCKPTCNVETNRLVISEYVLNPEGSPIGGFYEGLDFHKATVIKVFVQQREAYFNLRQSYFTQVDFFAQMGGIFNMFFGCSILSLCELVQLAWHKFQQIQRNKKNESNFKNVIIMNEYKITKIRRKKKKVRFKFRY